MAETVPPQETAPEKEKKLHPVAIIGLVLGGVTLLLVAGLTALGIFAPYALGILRDISIVLLAILAFFSMVLIVFMLAVIIFGINRLSSRLDDLLQRGSEVMDQVKGTATAVKGTAGFVGERIASPFIWIASRAAGLGKGVMTFLRGENRSGGSE